MQDSQTFFDKLETHHFSFLMYERSLVVLHVYLYVSLLTQQKVELLVHL